MEWPLVLAFVLVLLVGIWIGRALVKHSYRARFMEWMADAERGIREDAVGKSRAALGGKLSEQLAPFFPDFRYDPTEVRFIGSPVDLLVFPGLAGDSPREIVFMEVKTGSSKLTPRERKVRELVEQKKVRWEEYRPDTDKASNA